MDKTKHSEILEKILIAQEKTLTTTSVAINALREMVESIVELKQELMNIIVEEELEESEKTD